MDILDIKEQFSNCIVPFIKSGPYDREKFVKNWNIYGESVGIDLFSSDFNMEYDKDCDRFIHNPERWNGSLHHTCNLEDTHTHTLTTFVVNKDKTVIIKKSVNRDNIHEKDERFEEVLHCLINVFQSNGYTVFDERKTRLTCLKEWKLEDIQSWFRNIVNHEYPCYLNYTSPDGTILIDVGVNDIKLDYQPTLVDLKNWKMNMVKGLYIDFYGFYRPNKKNDGDVKIDYFVLPTYKEYMPFMQGRFINHNKNLTIDYLKSVFEPYLNFKKLFENENYERTDAIMPIATAY